MLYDVKLNTAQLEAIYDWHLDDADGGADVLIARQPHGAVEVAQGDARVVIAPDGSIREETP